jgi:uncharacterized OB-fold protein
MCQLYDCYTYTVLVSLEDYGFCAKGEGGALAASGELGPGGSLPVNTGGGQLSGYYMWGFTPLSEAVIQARGDGGKRQSTGTDIILVSGNGGILDHHATLILSPHPTRPARAFSSPGAAGPAALAGSASLTNSASPTGSPGGASSARPPPGAALGPDPSSAPSATAGWKGAAAVEIAAIARDDRSASFFAAAAQETLLIKRCRQCGIWLGPEAGGCPDCGDSSAGRPRWVPASGYGTLISWAVIHPRPVPQDTLPAAHLAGSAQADPPTVLALVELDEGPWLHTMLGTDDPAALHCGDRVQAHWAHPPAGESYPYFRPALKE